jgi:hypothetical protein
VVTRADNYYSEEAERVLKKLDVMGYGVWFSKSIKDNEGKDWRW